MQQFLIAVILAMLVNLAGAPAFTTLSVTHISGSSTVDSNHIENCHEMSQHDLPHVSASQLPGVKCHTCCQALAVPSAPYNLPRILINHFLRPVRSSPPYTDITYSIYKPPKTVT